ncbi:MAG: ROK family transcriptional regulator [Microbacterium sp.]
MVQSHMMSSISSAMMSADVRRHNLALVARCIAESGPLARSEIADLTGVSRASVTGLTATLIDQGLVQEAEPEPAARRGRRLQRLSISAPTIALVVVLIDADRVTVVAADLTGRELFRVGRAHARPLSGPGAVLDMAAELIDEALAHMTDAERTVVDVTVVAFAPVGGDPDIVLADSDLGWGPVDVIAELRSRSARLATVPRRERLHLVADVLVAAAAEFARLDDTTEALYIKSDSGIGGAVLARGALLQGAHGLAAGLGHVAVVPDGELCICGQHGCLVTVAGPDAILRAAGLADLAADEGLAVALVRFVERVQAADAVALEVWGEAASWVGRTLNILAMALDPAVIVIGGYWTTLFGDIETAFHANRPSIDGRPLVDVQLIPGVHGDEAALRGALRDARLRLLDDQLSVC